MSRLDFLYRTELSHRAVAVYIYLADRTNENNECWPAIPTIASDLKLSPSTVRRGIRDHAGCRNTAHIHCVLLADTADHQL